MSRELITLEVTKEPDNPRKVKVVFVPPADEVLAEYVHALCRDLAGGEEHPEIEEGLVAFLRIWTRAYARERTAQHNGGFDSRIE